MGNHKTTFLLEFLTKTTIGVKFIWSLCNLPFARVSERSDKSYDNISIRVL